AHPYRAAAMGSAPRLWRGQRVPHRCAVPAGDCARDRVRPGRPWPTRTRRHPRPTSQGATTLNHAQHDHDGAAHQIPPQPSTPPTASRTPRPRRHTADAAIEVLSEVRVGRYGMLDDTDFVMVFTEPDRVRKAVHDDLVHH